MISKSDSRVFLAWLVCWNGCPWKTLPTWQVVRDFCRMFGVFFVGIGAGRTSSLIKESLGMNFQLDLISSCCAVQPCHPLLMLCQFNFRWLATLAVTMMPYCPWYHLSHHGQFGFFFSLGLCLFGSDLETYKGVPMRIYLFSLRCFAALYV